MKSELEEHYSEFKDVFDVLPVNTVANRKKRIQYLLDEEKETDKNIKLVLEEINSRLSKFEARSNG